MATGQLLFQPPKFDWHVEDQQIEFEEWKGQITLALEASNISRERWYATIVGFLGKEGFKQWTLSDTKNEKTVHKTELLFHATKHFEVKKWVRSKKK